MRIVRVPRRMIPADLCRKTANLKAGISPRSPVRGLLGIYRSSPMLSLTAWPTSDYSQGTFLSSGLKRVLGETESVPIRRQRGGRVSRRSSSDLRCEFLDPRTPGSSFHNVPNCLWGNHSSSEEVDLQDASRCLPGIPRSTSNPTQQSHSGQTCSDFRLREF
jgi:hypothetical protein